MDSRITEIEGVILAGGRSQRMGTNKAFVNWDGKPLVEVVAETIGAVFARMFIVANEQSLFAHLGVPVFSDVKAGFGPLGGIHSALTHAQTGACFVVGCDMPFLDTELIRQMVAELGNYDAVVAQVKGRFEPLHAVYRRRVLSIAERQIEKGDYSLQRFVGKLNVRAYSEVKLANNAAWIRSFRSLNSPEEIESTRRERQNIRPADTEES